MHKTSFSIYIFTANLTLQWKKYCNIKFAVNILKNWFCTKFTLQYFFHCNVNFAVRIFIYIYIYIFVQSILCSLFLLNILCAKYTLQPIFQIKRYSRLLIMKYMSNIYLVVGSKKQLFLKIKRDTWHFISEVKNRPFIWKKNYSLSFTWKSFLTKTHFLIARWNKDLKIL